MRAIPLVVLFLLLVNFSLAEPAHAKPGEADGAENAADVNPERYFAVTLRSSFTPIPDKQAKREITDRPVYLIQSRAFGKNVYNLRVGFFDSFRDASTYRNSVLARYPAAVVTEIGRNEYATIQRAAPVAKPAVPPVEAARVAPVTPIPAVPVPVPAPTPPAAATAFAPKALYVIQLEESARPIRTAHSPLPASLKNNRLYVTQTGEKDKTRYQLKLGFFEKEQEVFAARRQLKATYPNAKVTRITPKEQNDSARMAVGAPVAPILAAPAVPAAPPARTPARVVPAAPPASLPSVAVSPATSGDKEALALMDKARTALARGDNRTAVVTLDKLLRMPPNRYSQDAQEFIGLARERSGETAAARKEYELYLRLYPAGEGADRVRQRIAALDATRVAPSPVFKAAKPRVEVLSTVIGSLSQHYYHGASQVDTTDLIPTAGSENQATLTQTDQSALVTNLNLTHRYRSENFDNRFVIRDTHTKNFLVSQDDENRLSALYYELKDRKRDYSARLGRQPGSSGGVLGRFDGATAGYNFTPKWRVNVVGGKPVDISYDTDLKFYGTSVEMGPFAEHWGGSLYTIQQKADGVTDRNAVGGELRYFDPRFTVYGLYDYDTEFATSNIILLQGNWTGGSGTSAHVLYDRRKTPSLTLTNALLGEADTSIKSQLQAKSYDQLKQQALDLTSTTDMVSVGMSQSLSTRWQLGFDVQSAHTSATVGTASQPAQADTGDIYTYTGNIIGTGLFTQRDVNVLSISRIDAPEYTGNSYSLTNRLLWGPSWGLDVTLSWYSQHNTITDTKLERFSPVLRPSYKWKENITLEAEFGEERTTTTTPSTKEENHRRYWSLGYRWDF
jgi:tetratricopeptide (TPR) repeat protein